MPYTALQSLGYFASNNNWERLRLMMLFPRSYAPSATTMPSNGFFIALVNSRLRVNLHSNCTSNNTNQLVRSCLSNMSVLNPSLGRLESLPAELRNRIYKLAADSSDEEIDIRDSCHPHGALSLVSKQVHCESIGLISAIHKEPCRHRRYVFEIPLEFSHPDEVHDNNDVDDNDDASFKCHDIHTKPITYRFLTAHLGEDVPLAVVVTLRGVMGSVVTFYGASEERNKDEKRFQADIYLIPAHSLTPTNLEHIDSKTWSMIITRIAICLRCPPGLLREAAKPPSNQELLAALSSTESRVKGAA